jgi:hypothetical protein
MQKLILSILTLSFSMSVLSENHKKLCSENYYKKFPETYSQSVRSVTPDLTAFTSLLIDLDVFTQESPHLKTLYPKSYLQNCLNRAHSWLEKFFLRFEKFIIGNPSLAILFLQYLENHPSDKNFTLLQKIIGVLEKKYPQHAEIQLISYHNWEKNHSPSKREDWLKEHQIWRTRLNQIPQISHNDIAELLSKEVSLIATDPRNLEHLLTSLVRELEGLAPTHPTLQRFEKYRLASSSRSHIREFLDRAQKHLENGKITKAMVSLNEGLRQHPQNPELRLYMAETLINYWRNKQHSPSEAAQRDMNHALILIKNESLNSAREQKIFLEALKHSSESEKLSVFCPKFQLEGHEHPDFCSG